jgi:hypothetical protein
MTPREVSDLRRWFDASGGIADGDPFLGDRRMDAFVDVMLEMAAQLWVVKRRNAVLEDLLIEKGALAAADMEQHSLSPDRAASLKAERAEFVATLFRSLADLPAVPPPAAQDRRT